LEAQTTKGLGGKEPNVLIIGCDYHPGFQQIAFGDRETGELREQQLVHREETEQFYKGCGLPSETCPALPLAESSVVFEIGVKRKP
jgi:hypothetical protein